MSRLNKFLFASTITLLILLSACSSTTAPLASPQPTITVETVTGTTIPPTNAPTAIVPTATPITPTTVAPTLPFTPTRAPTSTATTTATAIPTVAAIPSPLPTPGASGRAPCGQFIVEQQVISTGPGAAVGVVNLRDAQGQIVKTFKANTQQFESVQALYCADLTGSGAADLVLSTFSGGAHCCWTYDILAMTKDLPSLLHWEAGNGGINRFAVLSGKLPYEIIASDDRFAYAFDLPYVASPFLPVVFAYHDGKYIAATRDYPQILRDDQALGQDEVNRCAGDETCQKDFALKIYADGILLNQEAQTLAQLKTQVNPSVYTWLQTNRAQVIQLLTK